jgi:hypothetical protein
MNSYTQAAMERAMKVQEVMLQARWRRRPWECVGAGRPGRALSHHFPRSLEIPVRKANQAEIEKTDGSIGGGLTHLVTGREHVVTAERKIIKCCGVPVPTGGIHFFGANDMRGGAHLHATLALRTFDQRNFQFNGGARFKFTRSQKINAGRAYIARNKCDRNGFFDARHSN